MTRPQKPRVYLDFTTPWGSDSIRVSAQLYERAKARKEGKLNPDGAGCRDHICIRVKEKLIAKGATIYRLEWHHITFAEPRVEGEPKKAEAVTQPTPLQAHKARVKAAVDAIPLPVPSDEDINETAGMFPDTFRVATAKQIAIADATCGCVPYSVTTK